MTTAPKPDDDLWDPLDHPAMRRRIEDGTVEEWGKVFPVSYGGVKMVANNIRLEGKDRFSLKEQRKAWMEDKELGRSLKADFELYDDETGDKLDERPGVTLMRVPYYSDRGTFVYNGNHYPAAIQSRMMPGAYARKQSNGGLEVQVNTRAGTGKVFRVALEPETGQFRMRIKGGDMHLYSLLNALGVPDEQLSESWGPEVLELNSRKVDKGVLDRAYKKFVPEYGRTATNDQEKGGLIIDALQKTQITKSVVGRTLGAYWPKATQVKKSSDAYREILFGLLGKEAAAKPAKAFDLRSTFGDVDDEGDEYQPFGIDGVLASSRKLLAINRGMDEVDERQNLAFFKLYPMDKLMRERIRLDEGKLRRSLLRAVAGRRDLSALHHRVFDPYHREMITKNPLTSPVEETNPFQLITQHRRVTQMGPGGIGSTDAVTAEHQAVQPSEFGFYSPFEVPESGAAGVEVRITAGTRIGKDGRLKQRFRNLQTGTVEWKSPADLVDSVVKIPD